MHVILIGKETKYCMVMTHALFQSSPGGLGGTAGVKGQRDGKFWEGKRYYRVKVGACMSCICEGTCTCKCDNVHSCMDTCTCICSSAHSCECVADGKDAMAVS